MTQSKFGYSVLEFCRQVSLSPLQSQPNLQTYKPLKHPSSSDSYQRIRFSCCVASLFRIYLEPSDADLMMRGNANDFLISAQHLIAFKKRVHILEKKEGVSQSKDCLQLKFEVFNLSKNDHV